LFLNADEKVYGRYGGRTAESPDQFLSRAGLKYAMQEALAAHRREPKEKTPTAVGPPRTVEQYPAAKRLKENACIHCHQVYDFHRQAVQEAGAWQREEVWVYPLPENIGLTLAVDQGNRVQAVAANSAASQAGLRPGDVLRSLHGMPVASIADVQYALQRSPATGSIAIVWQRDGYPMTSALHPVAGWRQTDLSWRASTRQLGPPPCVHGEDLTAEEKEALGLSRKRLAFRQGNFVTPVARQAGIQQHDIILGADHKVLEMTVAQFGVYIRLNYQVGDLITFNLLRQGRRLDVALKLPNRAPF